MKDVAQLFEDVVLNLEKKKVPARIKHVDNEIIVECGWNYSDSICNKVFDVIEKLTGNCNSDLISLCADHSGGTVHRTKTICGGPKRR